MTRVVVHGSRGRMGARLIALAEADERIESVHALDRLRPADVDDAGRHRGSADVIIDFSADAGTALAARYAERLGTPLLVGTTALSPTTRSALERAAGSVAVMIAPNTSIGMALLRRVASEAARALDRSFDVDIVEHHHRGKVDAPSGSALLLADAVAAGRGEPVAADRVHAIRAGDIVGEHVVEFAGPGERVRLGHAVTDRDVFARGALHAAIWLSGRNPGIYAIEDSLSPP